MSISLSAGEEAYLGDAGMRIMWQLILGSAAGFILLAGCVLIFGARGGMFLIHVGDRHDHVRPVFCRQVRR